MCDYFYCYDCEECFYVDCFLHCDTCDKMIKGERGIGFVCKRHKDNEYTCKNYIFTLCDDCCDLIGEKDKDILKKIEELINTGKKTIVDPNADMYYYFPIIYFHYQFYILFIIYLNMK